MGASGVRATLHTAMHAMSKPHAHATDGIAGHDILECMDSRIGLEDRMWFLQMRVALFIQSSPFELPPRRIRVRRILRTPRFAFRHDMMLRCPPRYAHFLLHD